jgi:hypothetical protein
MGEKPGNFVVKTTDQPDHERSDARIRPLAIFLAGLVGSIFFVGLIVWLLFDIFLATVNRPVAELQLPRPTDHDAGQPRLQVVPRAELQALRAREDQLLGAHQWIDRQKGIARIPISAAMEQIASQGMPKWPPAVEQPGTQQPAPAPGGHQPTQSSSSEAPQ